MKAHPEFQRIRVRITGEGSTEGWFDFKKLERALLNLLLNACEVVPADAGKIDIGLRRTGENRRFESPTMVRESPTPFATACLNHS